MTFEQFNTADRLIKSYADVLASIQDIRNRFKDDKEISEQLTKFYFELKNNCDKKLKEI